VQFSEGSCLVLLYELLLGQGVKPHGGAERTFLKHASDFRSAADKCVAAADASSLKDLVPREAPRAHRHVRVNTLLGAARVAAVVKQLAEPPNTWPEKHQRPITAVKDALIDECLVLPGDVDMHDHPLAQDGSIVLQSKASCMPVAALRPERGWTVVDCCAAPGNKTSHASSRVGCGPDGGWVLAFEKDEKRCQLLKQTLERAHTRPVGASNVEVLQQVCACGTSLILLRLLSLQAGTRLKSPLEAEGRVEGRHHVWSRLSYPSHKTLVQPYCGFRNTGKCPCAAGTG
jgi:25S rRNA (cytosine2278-C5)-methyltransferase